MTFVGLFLIGASVGLTQETPTPETARTAAREISTMLVASELRARGCVPLISGTVVDLVLCPPFEKDSWRPPGEASIAEVGSALWVNEERKRSLAAGARLQALWDEIAPEQKNAILTEILGETLSREWLRDQAGPGVLAVTASSVVALAEGVLAFHGVGLPVMRVLPSGVRSMFPRSSCNAQLAAAPPAKQRWLVVRAARFGSRLFASGVLLSDAFGRVSDAIDGVSPSALPVADWIWNSPAEVDATPPDGRCRRCEELSATAGQSPEAAP